MPVAPASRNTPIFSMSGGSSLIIFCAFSGRILRLLGAKIKPNASAPASVELSASSREVVPQILIQVRMQLFFGEKLLWLLTGRCHANEEKPRWMANTILHPARAAAISAQDLQLASGLHQSGMPGSQRHAARGFPRRCRSHFPLRAARGWEYCPPYPRPYPG